MQKSKEISGSIDIEMIIIYSRVFDGFADSTRMKKIRFTLKCNEYFLLSKRSEVKALLQNLVY
jgi:hypothetical protein